MSYKRKLANPLWQKKRLEILKRDKWKCRLCKDKETELHVHHEYYEDGLEPWEYPNKCYLTLCSDCHIEVEEIKKTHPTLKASEVSIDKSNCWEAGSRIMFCSYKYHTHMRIYDEDGDFICGYNFTEDKIISMKKLFQISLKYIKVNASK